jgi:hypothetical protein
MQKNNAGEWEHQFTLPTQAHAIEFAKEVGVISKGWGIGEVVVLPGRPAFPEKPDDPRFHVLAISKTKAPLHFAMGIERAMHNMYFNRVVHERKWRDLPLSDLKW